jgi:hypothetical protein
MRVEESDQFNIHFNAQAHSYDNQRLCKQDYTSTSHVHLCNASSVRECIQKYRPIHTRISVSIDTKGYTLSIFPLAVPHVARDYATILGTTYTESQRSRLASPLSDNPHPPLSPTILYILPI